MQFAVNYWIDGDTPRTKEFKNMRDALKFKNRIIAECEREFITLDICLIDLSSIFCYMPKPIFAHHG